MEINQKPKLLRSLGYYILKAFAFYKLKNETIAPLVFIIILASNFINSMVITYTPDSIDAGDMGSTFTGLLMNSFVMNLLTSTILALYFVAYIKELKGEMCTSKECFLITAKRFFKFIVATILFNVPLPLSALLTNYPPTVEYVMYLGFLLIVPGIVLYLMFFLNTGYVLDGDTGIIQAFKSSKNATDGQKGPIFGVILSYNLLVVLFYGIVSTFVAESGELMQAFVISFISTVFAITKIRLLALIYKDMEYGVEYGVEHGKVE